MINIKVSELLYAYNLNITGMTEYGINFEELMSQKVPIPPEGARFDIVVEGAAREGKLKGTLKGVDYIWMRADGRLQLDIHAEITTDDGQKISLKGDGVSLPTQDSSVFDLRENVTLFSSSKDYTWVNPLQVWAIGTVDLAKKIVEVSGYSA